MLLTLKELCLELKVSRNTVKKWERKGFPCYQEGKYCKKRYDLLDSIKWMKENL